MQIFAYAKTLGAWSSRIPYLNIFMRTSLCQDPAKALGCYQESAGKPQQKSTSDQNLISRNKMSWILSNLDRNIRKTVEKNYSKVRREMHTLKTTTKCFLPSLLRTQERPALLWRHCALCDQSVLQGRTQPCLGALCGSQTSPSGLLAPRYL